MRLFARFALLSCLVLVCSTGVLASDKFSSDQIKQIQNIVHDYVVENPQILMEAGKKLQEQELNKRKELTVKALPKFAKQLFGDNAPGTAFLGNPKGKVILAEFLSYQCGHCKTSAEVIERMLKKHPELKVVFVEWPIFGNDAVYAAKMALAAHKQNKFAEVHAALLKATEPLNKVNINKIIGKLGLDKKKLDMAAADKSLDEALKNNFKMAQELGLMGTPAFIFTNEKMNKFSLVPGQTPEFEADLEKAIKEVK